MSKSYLFCLLAILSLGVTLPASATTVSIGASAPTTSITSIFGPSLSGTSLGVWTGTFFTGTQNTSLIKSYLDPISGSGYYAYVQSGSIEANFAGGIDSLNFLWGSPDTYNSITFYSGPNATGMSETYSPGTGMLSGLAATQTGGTLVTFSTTGLWQSVVFSSTGNSFEFAVITASSGTIAPEPTGIGLLAAGFLAAGASAIRRRIS